MNVQHFEMYCPQMMCPSDPGKPGKPNVRPMMLKKTWPKDYNMPMRVGKPHGPCFDCGTMWEIFDSRIERYVRCPKCATRLLVKFGTKVR